MGCILSPTPGIKEWVASEANTMLMTSPVPVVIPLLWLDGLPDQWGGEPSTHGMGKVFKRMRESYECYFWATVQEATSGIRPVVGSERVWLTIPTPSTNRNHGRPFYQRTKFWAVSWSQEQGKIKLLWLCVCVCAKYPFCQTSPLFMCVCLSVNELSSAYTIHSSPSLPSSLSLALSITVIVTKKVILFQISNVDK